MRAANIALCLAACAAPPPPYCIGILRCFMHAQGKYWKNGFLAYGAGRQRLGVYGGV